MSRPHGRRAKNRFLGRGRRRPLKSITLLPSLVTILNGLFGFMAIVFASNARIDNHHFVVASYLILLAMIADMLDGSLARMSQSTSSFGGQLDSLCDIISFGVAPAFIMLKLMQLRLVQDDLAHSTLIGRCLLLAAFAYITCAAIRLARFNVENVEQGSEHMAFAGLPTPAAAGVLISFVLFHQDVIPQWTWLLWILPVLTFGMAALMVSRIPYPHVVNHYLKGKKPLGVLIKVLILLGLVVTQPGTALFLVFGSFAANGPLRRARQRWLRSHRHSAEEVSTSSAPAPTSPQA